MSRNDNGTFAPGNPGGPGRPRRTLEREYLAVLLDTISISDWRAIIAKAVDDAKAGDGRARDWLARYILPQPLKPTELAADEIDLTPEEEIERARTKRAGERKTSDLWAG